MEKIIARKLRTSREKAYTLTQEYMQKGVEQIEDLVNDNLQSEVIVKSCFEEIFSEHIPSVYITRFWTYYNKLSQQKQKELIRLISEWFCEMGNIMGYCGIVLGAVNTVKN